MRKLLLSIFALLCIVGATGQTVNTLYFLDNAPMKYQFNPAFKPLSRVYIGIPMLGGLSYMGGNNSVSLNDLLYTDPMTGRTSWIFGNIPAAERMNFFNGLKQSIKFNADANVNILSAGWAYGEKNYWHISFGLKQNGTVGLPKGLFEFGLFGMENGDLHTYDLSQLSFDESLYLEGGLSYSRDINEHVRIGGTLKVLYGVANVRVKQENLSLGMSEELVHINGNGNVDISGPIGIPEGGIENLGDIEFSNNIADYLTPAGIGGAIDLGIVYKPVEMLTISAGVSDLGFINWFKNGYQVGYGADYTYNGFEDITLETDFNEAFDSLIVSLTEAPILEEKAGGYTRMISPKVNLGVEANFCDNRIGLGAVYTSKFLSGIVWHEVTLGASFRPFNWLNIAANYSLANNQWSTIGVGIGLRGGPINLTVMADYVPFHFATIEGAPIPSRVKGMNIGVGLNLVFGNKAKKKVEEKEADVETVIDAAE